jgi:O-antigen/teichoic acid export membrane protein
MGESATTQPVKTGIFARLTQRVRAIFADRLTRNVGWYGLAELSNRVTRLVTTIILARWLIPNDFGIAAIAITTYEIMHVFAQNGIGQAVVRATADKLPGLCITAYRAGWIACIFSLIVQCIIGLIAAHVTGRPDLFWMIAALAMVYVILPFGQIQAHLIVRDNRLHVLAGIAVVQVAVENALTAIFAIYGFGPWSIVLPKLITAPIWVIGMRRAQTWTRDKTATPAPMSELVTFAAPIIGSELLVAARFNADKILVGSILGIDAMGIYFFVFNAGIGFSLSLTSALSASVYPHLAELSARPREMLARYDQLFWTAVIPCASVIALQAAGALLYVPIVFGAKWAYVAPLVAALCASAIAKPAFDAACQLLRAAGQPRRELLGSMGLTALSMATLALALPHGLPTAITALALSLLIAQLAFVIAVRRLIAAQVNEPSHLATHTPSPYPAGAHS